MIKALLIDYDDTIADFKKSEAEALNKTFNYFNIAVNEELLAKYHEFNSKCWKDFEKGLLTREEIYNLRWQMLFSFFNLDAPINTNDVYFSYLGNTDYLINNAKEILEKLTQKYDLYIVTNGEIIIQKPRFKKSGIEKYIKKSFISQEIGFNKPQKEFFDFVMNEIKLDINEVVVIGDSLTSDIKGAVDYGLKAIWYNPNNKISDWYNGIQIQNLEEIEAIIEKW